MNFVKKVFSSVLGIFKGDIQDNFLWLDDVSRFFTAYIFPIFAFLILFLVHLYFSEHVKLCQSSFEESISILQNDCVNFVFFFRTIPRLPRICYMLICVLIYCFMATTYVETMASAPMQEVLYLIRLEKDSCLAEIKFYIEKIKNIFKK